MSKKAVVLLSGGADSATTLAIAVKEGYEIYALTIDYGQRNDTELITSARQAGNFKVAEHKLLKINLGSISQSALTGGVPVPHGRSMDEIFNGIPVTYVPARNTIFLSLALGWAESIGTGDIFIGVNAVDFSGYPDCRPEYIDSFEKMANLATKIGVEGKGKIKIRTPLIDKTKGQIFKLGTKLGVDFSFTHSCYSPANDTPCGLCDSCLLRKKGFEEAGLDDPLHGRR